MFTEEQYAVLYLETPHSLLILLSYITQDHQPRDDTHTRTVGWVLPSQLLIKKMSYRPAHHIL